MEGLISGKALAVQDGAALLGLSAWHIYPDTTIHGSPVGDKTVKMNDSLVAGVLSQGVSKSGLTDERGVYWSLSLAHHRFYGEAVQKTKRLDVDGWRLSLNEFFLVCMGALLRAWSVPRKPSCAYDTIRLLKEIAECAQHFNGTSGLTALDETYEWKAVMNDIYNTYTSDEKRASIPISLGRGSLSVLPDGLTDRRKPYFQLAQFSVLLFLITDENHQVELLRRLCTRIEGLTQDNSIIFYREYSKMERVFASAVMPKADQPGWGRLRAPYKTTSVSDTSASEYPRSVEDFQENTPLPAFAFQKPIVEPLDQRQRRFPNEKITRFQKELSRTFHGAFSPTS
ncbi:hypothetical protein F5Y14DRAFT_447469 [Nemania sp. NC0429]|nr:hypothetical protein F5Y14DRAFT_447469 [Nemania sp. NC0429]